MKKSVLKIIFITVALLLITLSPAYGALRAEPVSRSPFNQRDRFETDLFTGSAVYSYPFKIPKGTNDLTPELSISYNSLAARDLSVYTGIGWQLNREYIERDVNFTPGNTGDDKYKLHFKGGVYDLIFVPAENKYHTKTESFLNIQKLTGGQNELGEYWQITTRDGTKYRFGNQNQSELMCNGRNYISMWNLDQVEDTHGNKIFYTYVEVGGVSYPTKIEYNNDKQRVIEYSYYSTDAPSPYYRQAYHQGCNIITDSWRLRWIQINSGGNMVRQYNFNTIAASNGQPLLQSITEKGSDGSALPATAFTYKPENRNWSTQPIKWLDHAEVDSHLRMTTVAMSDVNGDGLLDIVRTLQVSGGSSWKVLLNQGNSWSSQFQTWNNNPIGDDPRLDRTDTRIMDVTGDNLPDLIMANGADQWRVWRNSGTSFNTQYEVWANLSNIHNEIHLNNNRVRLADVTGDGLPDIVRTWWNGQQQWEVFRNTGSNWSGAYEVWSYANIPQDLSDPTVAIIDINGDGLADVVKTTNSGTNATWTVYKNTGSNWAGSENWINNANVDAYISKGDVTMADADGDGLVDIVKSDDGGGSDRWKTLRNMGNSWSTAWETWIDPSSNQDVDVHNDDVRLADVTGDGLIDIIRGREDCSCSFDTWTVWKNNGKASNLLSSVKTSQGGTISFDYKASTTVDNTGPDDKSDLPFNLWLVEKKTENNGMTNSQQTNDVTTYSYKDGFYKWQDKEFRGFGTIDETLSNTAKRTYVFNQDDALKGLLAEVQTRNNQNNPYAETENTWQSSQSNGIYTVNLTQEKNYTYDGVASNPKTTQNDYQYDNFGNVTKKSEIGDAGITGDERFTYFEYTTNPSLWIINALKHTFMRAANDTTKVSESWLYYDGNPGLDDPPAKGDITKEVKWLEGGTNPTTLSEYNSFGNRTKITDANNRITQYAYDTTGTYPISTTNAKNQTTTMNYDLGTGNLLSQTDPNNFTTSYQYDVFGRIKKEIKPYDTSTHPTTNYQYFFDGTAPEGTLISKREVSGATRTLDVYTWADGLGRKLQTRADAEDTTKQIVANTFYDVNGEIAKETIPHLDNANTAYATPLTGIKTTEFTYDTLERITNVKNTKGDTRTTAYDHWKQTHTDEKGNIKREFLNAYEKINKVEEVNGASTYTTNYEYNTRDELTKITNALGNINTLTYDSLGRRKSQTDPDMGTWQYEYDGADNLTKKTDNSGIASTMIYDQLNRRTKVDYPTDTDILYTYDANSKIGTLTSVTDVAGTLNFSYDNRLRKTQETRVIDGNTWTTQYAYDALDRITTQTNPDGQTVTFSHNPQGEINTVNGILNNIDYNAQGKITKKDFANALTTNYTYNSDDFRLNKIQTGAVFDAGYTYDKVGNVLSITDNLLTKTQNFGYDALDRLISAQETGSYTHAYVYNAIGNLTKLTDSGNVIDYTYGQNAGVHALTSSTENAPTATPTPTPTPSGETEILNTTWTLTGNNGSDEKFKGIPADSIAGKTSVKVTFDLRGKTFGGGDDEASIIFVQNGDWRVANVTLFGAQNGLNGSQTVTIPITSFHKIGNSNITLDPNQPVSDLRARFWNSGAFTVDITSIKVVGSGSGNPTPTPTPTAAATPTPTPASSYTFFKGINFNGNAVTIESNSWQSMTTALSNGLSIPSGYTNATTSLTPNPAANSDMNAMLNSGIWKGNATLAIDQTLSNGNYQLYLWVMENYQNNQRKFNVKLEGTQVATEIGYLSKNSWVKYGPYNAAVNDGTLDIDLVNVVDSPHVMGMAIYQQSSNPQPSPTSTPTPTQTPTPASGWTEILGTTWTLTGSNGSDEEDKTIASNILNGKTSVQVIFDLHGKTFGGGDDEAAIIFIQNGDWRVANITLFGGQNGLNGSQTVTIPISSFHKVGNSSIVLDPNQPVSNLHTRFWNSGTFTVDITSVKVQ